MPQPGSRVLDKNSREYFEHRKSELLTERSSFESHWKSLSEAVQPNKGRFLISDRNKGDRRWQEIVNAAATRALRVATAGLFAGTMSPARPWFTWDPPDPEMKEFQPVKLWLKAIEDLMFRIFNESNLYVQAPGLLKELLLFGTGAMHHDDDFEDVARFYTHTIGSYAIGQDHRRVVNTFMREFEMTTEAIVRQFGLDNVSQTVRDAWDRSNYHQWYPVVHFIEQNPFVNPSNRSSRSMPFRSVYYEPGQEKERNRFLRRSGFEEFPLYAPRWDVTGEDIYGTDCPGMTALGDSRQLQSEEKAKAMGIHKSVNPPLTGPADLKDVNGMPGGLTLHSATSESNRIQPVFVARPDISGLVEDMREVVNRIREDFFVDLFQAITNADGIQPRNQLELTQRDEERLLQLGPVLQQIHMGFLKNLVNRTFNQAARAGILPPAPPELQGRELQLRFISSVAMAQRAVATNEIDRLVGFVGNAAQVPGWERTTGKVDMDQAVDLYAQAIGAPPTLVKPDDLVAGERQAEDQAVAAQQQAVLEQQQAQTAKLARDASQ